MNLGFTKVAGGDSSQGSRDFDKLQLFMSNSEVINKSPGVVATQDTVPKTLNHENSVDSLQCNYKDYQDDAENRIINEVGSLQISN